MSRRFKDGTLFYSCSMRFYFRPLHVDLEEPEPEQPAVKSGAAVCCWENGIVNEL